VLAAGVGEINHHQMGGGKGLPGAWITGGQWQGGPLPETREGARWKWTRATWEVATARNLQQLGNWAQKPATKEQESNMDLGTYEQGPVRESGKALWGGCAWRHESLVAWSFSLIGLTKKPNRRAVVGHEEGTGRVRRCKVIIHDNQTLWRQRKA